MSLFGHFLSFFDTPFLSKTPFLTLKVCQKWCPKVIKNDHFLVTFWHPFWGIWGMGMYAHTPRYRWLPVWYMTQYWVILSILANMGYTPKYEVFERFWGTLKSPYSLLLPSKLCQKWPPKVLILGVPKHPFWGILGMGMYAHTPR